MHRDSFYDCNGKKITDNLEIANGLNKYFSEIGQKIANNPRTNTKSAIDYLSNVDSPSFSFTLVTDIKNLEAIERLKPKSSSGCDGVSNNLLKKLNYHCTLFNYHYESNSKNWYLPT